MAILEFHSPDVRRVVDHALAAPKHECTLYGQKSLSEGPAVFLVGDSGVYLMSNGLPIDLIETPCRRFVAYAKGMHPDVDDGWYDLKREVFGGDDGADLLPWCNEMKRFLDDGRSTIAIELTADNCRLLK